MTFKKTETIFTINSYKILREITLKRKEVKKMKTAILILSLVLLPTLLSYSQIKEEPQKDTQKNKTVYLVIRNIDCYDCQGLGYINTYSFDFKRGDNSSSHNGSSGTIQKQLTRITCPYCGGKGKIEISEYRSKL